MAVNESTWEYLKLATFPTYIWFLVGLGLDINNLALGVLTATLAEMIIIPIIFYSYTHFTKKPILFVAISSFFVAVGFAMLFANLIFALPELNNIFKIVAIICNILIACCFIIFTYCPPKIFLFRDPISHKYGVAGHF